MIKLKDILTEQSNNFKVGKRQATLSNEPKQCYNI